MHCDADFVANLSICDTSTEGWDGNECIELILFSPNEAELPGTHAIGDIIVLLNVRVRVQRKPCATLTGVPLLMGTYAPTGAIL